MGNRYDHPNNLIRREHIITNLVGIGGTTMRKNIVFQRARLKAVHSLIITAGTNVAAGVDILNGTTSVGEITHGTDAALGVKTSGLIDTIVEANGYIDIKGKALSGTMVNSYTIEYEVLPDSVQT